ncbi:MlaD family protein [Rhodovibrio salinarum]|uniref:MCE family protein n=1 Tax=Rhodovibrio salinarum TaxID=1087 RepID=A0A934QLI5_9PROT|nr:MlaD family protein [Rhodovibrio salinarum]MBK1698810.1 MCE family protein [Rhodovibrio salinarum]
MRYRPNPKLIGAFVLGAIFLAVIAVAVLGGNRLFQTTRTAVAYFDQSVAGLSTGAPVTFRGVRVGQVRDINLRVETDELSARIPVIMEFQLDRIEWAGDEGFTQAQLDRLIERGLRAKLVSQSFVTGQLAVELGFAPDTPVRMVGVHEDIPEIPTAPGSLQQLKSSLENLPLRDILSRTMSTVDRLDQLLRQPAVQKFAPEALATLQEYRGLAQDLRGKVGPLVDKVGDSATSANETLDRASTAIQRIDRELTQTLQSVRQVTQTLNQRVGPLADKLGQTSDAATGAMRQAEETMASANSMIEPGSAAQRDLRRALDEFARAARAVRELAEQLERNPNALITGKGR